MWMQVYGDNKVMISDWPAQSGSTQDNICDASYNGTMNASVPSASALADRSFYWQAWIPNDPAAAGQGWACSNGLQT